MKLYTLGSEKFPKFVERVAKVLQGIQTGKDQYSSAIRLEPDGAKIIGYKTPHNQPLIKLFFRIRLKSHQYLWMLNNGSVKSESDIPLLNDQEPITIVQIPGDGVVTILVIGKNFGIKLSSDDDLDDDVSIELLYEFPELVVSIVGKSVDGLEDCINYATVERKLNEKDESFDYVRMVNHFLTEKSAIGFHEENSIMTEERNMWMDIKGDLEENGGGEYETSYEGL